MTSYVVISSDTNWTQSRANIYPRHEVDEGIVWNRFKECIHIPRLHLNLDTMTRPTYPVYNLGCDSEVLKRITEFRVGRQAEKKMDNLTLRWQREWESEDKVEWRSKMGEREMVSEKSQCGSSQCNPISRPMSAGHMHGMENVEDWAKIEPTGCRALSYKSLRRSEVSYGSP